VALFAVGKAASPFTVQRAMGDTILSVVVWNYSRFMIETIGAVAAKAGDCRHRQLNWLRIFCVDVLQYSLCDCQLYLKGLNRI